MIIKNRGAFEIHTSWLGKKKTRSKNNFVRLLMYPMGEGGKQVTLEKGQFISVEIIGGFWNRLKYLLTGECEILIYSSTGELKNELEKEGGPGFERLLYKGRPAVPYIAGISKRTEGFLTNPEEDEEREE